MDVDGRVHQSQLVAAEEKDGAVLVVGGVKLWEEAWHDGKERRERSKVRKIDWYANQSIE